MRAGLITALVGVAVAANGAVAETQPRQRGASRVYAGLSIGAQVTTSSVRAPLNFAVYHESTRVDTTWSWPAGPTFEVDAGVRLWRTLGVALTFTRASRDGESHVSGAIPHPYFFDQPRTLEASGPALQRTETDLHVGVTWTWRLTRRATITAIGGPSVMSVGLDAITGVVLGETYPYTDVRLTTATIARREATTLGLHAGGDVVYQLNRHVGVVGAGRYSHARAKLESTTGQHADVDLGGVVARGGVRWLF